MGAWGIYDIECQKVPMINGEERVQTSQFEYMQRKVTKRFSQRTWSDKVSKILQLEPL
ncbi:hypothetical protein DPMN_075762 [Dreissena polymorpha]|uniref:Uncharacterized protein n=1 Tax=Dreissena polymorpha TaxID=45954 RepID=A0A9D3YMC3_DREPO|nr:hypothetical protein DPMN_075762 [Dreissena polymorpha]